METVSPERKRSAESHFHSGRGPCREGEAGMAETTNTKAINTQYSCKRLVDTSAEFPAFLCETLVRRLRLAVLVS